MNRVNRAVVLAAGLGTRLKWLTSDSPKAMMNVGGEPAIVQVIRRLAGQGIHDIAINVHHHAGKLTDYLGDGSCLGVRLYYSREETLLDSGGGVRTALELLPGGGLVTVYNADVISDVDVQMLACQTPEKGVALALVPNPEHHPDGDFSMTSDMVVEDGLPRYTYSGISVWDEAALSSFQSGEAFPLVQPMRQLMGESRLAAAVHHGVWFDIGRPRDLMRARAFLNRRGWS